LTSTKVKKTRTSGKYQHAEGRAARKRGGGEVRTIVAPRALLVFSLSAGGDREGRDVPGNRKTHITNSLRISEPCSPLLWAREGKIKPEGLLEILLKTSWEEENAKEEGKEKSNLCTIHRLKELGIQR